MLFAIIFTMFSQVLADVKNHSLPISANFQPLKGGLTIVARDRARFQALFTKHEKRVQSVGLKNMMGLGYTMSVGFGSPPTYYNLLVDTGSTYTWIKRDKYAKTKTSIKQGDQVFDIQYTKGLVTGTRYKDRVTFSPSLSISDMSFGVASQIEDIDIGINTDGILGLGYTAFDESTPTIMDVLLAQKVIQRNVFGLSFAPATSPGTVDGELNFGGINLKKYKEWMNWVKITDKEPFNRDWGFEQTIMYGNQILQPPSVGNVDSGSTMIYITSEAFDVYSKSLPGSKIDPKTELLEIPEGSLGQMQSLFFVINGVSYEFPPSAQIWPHALNELLGGKADAYYSVIGPIGGTGGDSTPPGFINGYMFLQRFYTAYDASNSRIGFAHTPDVN